METTMRAIRVRADPERCLGCLACEVACAEAHAPGDAVPRVRVSGGISGGPEVRRYSVSVVPRRFPILCRQCEEPSCVTACKTGALSKGADGIVVLESDRCVGCGMCQMVCPFGGIRVDRSQRMAFKCEACRSLPVPACVTACPVHALAVVTEG